MRALTGSYTVALVTLVAATAMATTGASSAAAAAANDSEAANDFDAGDWLSRGFSPVEVALGHAFHSALVDPSLAALWTSCRPGIYWCARAGGPVHAALSQLCPEGVGTFDEDTCRDKGVNALNSYGQAGRGAVKASVSDIALLADDTLLGSASAGFLVVDDWETGSIVACHNMLLTCIACGPTNVADIVGVYVEEPGDRGASADKRHMVVIEASTSSASGGGAAAASPTCRLPFLRTAVANDDVAASKAISAIVSEFARRMSSYAAGEGGTGGDVDDIDVVAEVLSESYLKEGDRRLEAGDCDGAEEQYNMGRSVGPSQFTALFDYHLHLVRHCRNEVPRPGRWSEAGGGDGTAERARPSSSRSEAGAKEPKEERKPAPEAKRKPEPAPEPEPEAQPQPKSAKRKRVERASPSSSSRQDSNGPAVCDAPPLRNARLVEDFDAVCAARGGKHKVRHWNEWLKLFDQHDPTVKASGGLLSSLLGTTGVQSKCRVKSLQRNYRKLMLRYHPDKFDGPEECAQRVSLVVNAGFDLLRESPHCVDDRNGGNAAARVGARQARRGGRAPSPTSAAASKRGARETKAHASPPPPPQQQQQQQQSGSSGGKGKKGGKKGGKKKGGKKKKGKGKKGASGSEL